MKATLRGLVGVLVIVLGVQGVLAAEQADWYPTEEVVARQAKLREQRTQATWAYYEREIVGQYNKVGGHNPKWDNQMLALLRANIKERIGNYPDAQGLRLQAVNQCAAVQPADPYSAYLRAQTLPRTAATKEEYRLALGAACDQIMASRYTGIIRFHALCRKAGLEGTPGDGAEADGDRDAAENMLRQAIKELDGIAQAKDLPACEIRAIMDTAAETSLMLYQDRWKWTQQVYDVLAKYQGQSSALLAAKGELFVAYAWDARGDGWASTVTDEGWRLMRERLKTAEADFTAAWQKDPNCPESAIGMLSVELGQGKGADVMDLWFRRAIAVDPQSSEACERMRYYLEGKWHGSDEQMLGFARDVSSTVPKTSPLRLILWNAHRSLAYAAGGAKVQAEGRYFRQHPEAWAELKAMADDVVLAKDASNYSKTEMARVAVNAGDVASARRYLAVADPELSVSVYGAEYQRIKAIVDKQP